MELTWIQFAVILPLVGLAGFVDAIAGGGGLISLPAYMIGGLPPHAAIATNKLSSCMGTSVATANYIKKGFVNWKYAGAGAVCALVGSSIGANIALMISDHILKVAMLFLLPAIAVYLAKKKDFSPIGSEPSEKAKWLITAAAGLIIGMYDGMYGPGTGTFLLLILTGFAHMKLTEANGATKVINLTTNVASLAVYVLNGQTIILLGLCAGVCNMIGNYLGSNFFSSKGAGAVRPIMFIVLGIFFVKVLYDLHLFG
ncbi:MAG: TSUP family transporter [Bacillota bacterium]|uniref:Probable membrane transporter protein n=1 Tax=[Clostridium] aminophilum TaxID=1526 RepID=A0A1I6IU51_9FIRM|nr:TSUP family transporter [[Clostridium] aminophilum]MCR4628401.1 TSUP family transporter [Clostridium sp.]MDT3844665.1 TSUP family transporter [Bacillota bacterium]SFR70243.1 hypothetical protein SAMN02910262_00842 [[Clostridium] aminophilum]